MGRHTREVSHTLPNTDMLLLKAGNRVGGELEKLLKPFHSIMSVHIERGKDIEVVCLENIWTSGL